MPNSHDNIHLRDELVSVLENIWIENLAHRYVAINYCREEHPTSIRLIDAAREAQGKKPQHDERFRAIRESVKNDLPEKDFLQLLVSLLQARTDDYSIL